MCELEVKHRGRIKQKNKRLVTLEKNQIKAGILGEVPKKYILQNF